jgi:hypothetical protein
MNFIPPIGNKPRLTALFAAAFFLMLALAFTGCNGESGSIEEGGNGDPWTTPGMNNRFQVTFTGVNADGAEGQYKTTVLALHFNMEISGLSAADITLTDTGDTGAVKGTLTGDGPTYTLAVNGITKSGKVTVAVAKTGYDIKLGFRTVTVHYGTMVPTAALFTARMPTAT